jgi:hypothetical protein
MKKKQLKNKSEKGGARPLRNFKESAVEPDDPAPKISPRMIATHQTDSDNEKTEETTAAAAKSTSWESLSQWNDESVAQVADWWGMTEKDVGKLWQLHDRLTDVTHWKNQPNEVVRYLRDAHGNVKNSEAKFRRMVDWRISEEVDDIVTDYVLPHPLMQRYLPTTVLEGCDKEGDPIWLERVGAADSWGLLKAFGHDDLIRYAVYIREVCIRGEWARDYQRRRNGRPPMRATAIIDLEGLNWSHLKPGLLPLLRDGLHIVQEYYCGFGKKVIVIRAPALFSVVWKVAQHFCGENLKNMMVFATKENYLEVLKEYVDLEMLPPCIYPQGKGRGGVAMPNHLAGGKVPPKEELDGMLKELEKQMESSRGKSTQSSNVRVKISLLSEESTRSESNDSFTSKKNESSTKSVRIMAPSLCSLSDDEGSHDMTPTSASASPLSKPNKDTVSPIIIPNKHDYIDSGGPDDWSEESLHYVAKWWKATPEEVEKLLALKDRLDDIHHFTNHPKFVIYFLRDRHGNVDHAETKFRNMVAWRLEEHVDDIFERYQPPELMLDHFPVTCLKDYDKEGDPIWLERPGASDAWGVYQRWGRRNMELFNIWIRELPLRGVFCKEYERRQQRPPTKMLVILDLHGYNSRHMKSSMLPILKDVLRVIQDCYCGMAKKIIVIRAPAIFKVVWAIVHHFCDENLKSLLLFATHNNYMEILDEYVDRDVLPSCIWPEGKGVAAYGMPQELEGHGLLPLESKKQYSRDNESRTIFVAEREAHRTMPVTPINMPTKAPGHSLSPTTSVDLTVTSSSSTAFSPALSSSSHPVSHQFHDQNEIQPEDWSEVNFRKTMELWNVSDDEEYQVRQLQKRLKEVNHWKNSPVNMVRFLRDSRHKIDNAEDKFRKMIAWRIEHGIDHMLVHYRSPKLMQKYYASTFLKDCDYDGDPIYIERPGVTDSWSLYQRFGKEGMIQHVTWLREEAGRGEFSRDYKEKHGTTPRCVTCIVDLEGLSARHMKPGLLPMLRDLMRVTQDHYCGMAKRIFIIRGPSIFNLIWSIVQHFIDEKMKRIIVFAASSDYLDVLDQYMDLDVLPKCIYPDGKGEGGIGMPKSLDGGRVPKEELNAVYDNDEEFLETHKVLESPSECALDYNVGDSSKGNVSVGTTVESLCGGYFEFSDDLVHGGLTTVVTSSAIKH